MSLPDLPANSPPASSRIGVAFFLFLLTVTLLSAVPVGESSNPPAELLPPVEPRITLGGAIAAVVFAAALLGVIIWLLSVPRPVTAVAARARRIVSAIHRIVVPVHSHGNWAAAIELACRLGEQQRAEILLTSVVEIPFTLSLNTGMTKAVSEAQELLKQAATIVELHKLPVRTHIERARQAGEGIAKVARDADADLIVIAVSRFRSRLPGFPGRTIETLLNRAPCEVIIDAVPEQKAADSTL